jgi:hypothetical protein
MAIPFSQQRALGLLLPLAGIMLFTVGCTVTDTIYLQSLNINGPIAQPPVHITGRDTGTSVRLSPYLTMMNHQTVSGRYSGTPPPYGEASGNNLTWDITPVSGGVNIDIHASPSLAIGLGVHTGAGNCGGHAGLGLLTHGEDLNGRFEVGFQFQGVDYEAGTIVKHDVTSIFSSGTTTTYGYFLDHGTTHSVRYYLTFTVNSDNTNWFLNFFGQIGVSRQALTDYTPSQQVTEPLFPFPFVEHVRTDTRIGTTTTMLFFAPGIYLDVNPNMRWVAGVRLMGELNVFDAQPPLFAIPFVQCDFKL